VLTGRATRRRHPALGMRWITHQDARWPVRRAWPAGDGVVAVELVNAFGEAIGATVGEGGEVDLLAVDEALPTLAGWRSRVDATVVAHRPGKRAVVRVAGGTGRCTYVKIATPRAAARALERMATVVGLITGVAAAPGVAAVLSEDLAAGELVLKLLPGTSLAQLVATDAVEPARRGGAAAGRTIAALASCRGDGLPEHTADDEITVLDRWVDDALSYGAVTGVGADELRRRRDGAIEGLLGLTRRAARRATLAHRDLHDGQLLIGHDRDGPVGLLDWDTASAAAPALDAGNLLAHLDRLGARHQMSATACAHALAASARAAGHPAWTEDPAELAAWRIAAGVRLDAVHAFRS